MKNNNGFDTHLWIFKLEKYFLKSKLISNGIFSILISLYLLVGNILTTKFKRKL